MIAVTARRILTLLARVAPVSGRICRQAGRASGPAAPDAVVFRHYL